MSIAVTTVKVGGMVTARNANELARVQLQITGLTAGASNTVPHGLPYTPRVVTLTAVSATAGTVQHNAAWDATNLYILVGTAGPTTVYADCVQ
jgi:hypothetical protein